MAELKYQLPSTIDPTYGHLDRSPLKNSSVSPSEIATTEEVTDSLSDVTKGLLTRSDSEVILNSYSSIAKKLGRFLTSKAGGAITSILNSSTVGDSSLSPKQKADLDLQFEKSERSQDLINEFYPNQRLPHQVVDKRMSLQEENIAHKKVLNCILRQEGRWCANHYDSMFHPENGVMWKPNLTEDEKNNKLGYTQDIAKIFEIVKDWEGRGRELLQKNRDFKNWFFYKGPSKVSTKLANSNTIVPKIVWHGTQGTVSPSVGFWNRHAETRPEILRDILLGKLSALETEFEIAGHFGDHQQSLDHQLNKMGGERIEKHRGKPESIARVLYGDEFDSDWGTLKSDPKFYPGFIKMNNPIYFDKDAMNWDFDVILDNIFSDETSKYNKGGFTYSKEMADSIESDTEFPLLLPEFGKGTALEKVFKYARKQYEEDFRATRLPINSWNEEFGKLSPPEKAAIHYYKMHGLIEFLSKDLGYDGIIYRNEVEDNKNKSKKEENPSYILFHPWQFKSLFQGIKGKFKRGEGSFMGKYSKGKNKYKKVV